MEGPSKHTYLETLRTLAVQSIGVGSRSQRHQAGGRKCMRHHGRAHGLSYKRYERPHLLPQLSMVLLPPSSTVAQQLSTSEMRVLWGQPTCRLPLHAETGRLRRFSQPRCRRLQRVVASYHRVPVLWPTRACPHPVCRYLPPNAPLRSSCLEQLQLMFPSVAEA